VPARRVNRVNAEHIMGETNAMDAAKGRLQSRGRGIQVLRLALHRGAHHGMSFGRLYMATAGCEWPAASSACAGVSTPCSMHRLWLARRQLDGRSAQLASSERSSIWQ
jgi:hypothetical protein